MKIRTDFVTNSSSSSFIIGKRYDYDITVESVYQMLREYFKEYHQKWYEMADYVINRLKYECEVVTRNRNSENSYTELCKKEGCKKKFSMFEINTYKKFNISAYDILYNDEWIECETYKEYEKYWIDKMRKSDNDYLPHAPFTIYSFEDTNDVVILHIGKIMLNPEYNDFNATDILEWYFPYVEEALNGEEFNEKIQMNRGEYEELVNRIMRENITKDNASICLLGKICIDSESGNIPEYVVNKLRVVSQYACNHMG